MSDNINHIFDQITRLLEKNPRIHKGILFGSRALGTARTGSDIDIALVGDISYRDIIRLKVAYDELYLPYHVDFISYASIENMQLREHIDRVGKIILER